MRRSILKLVSILSSKMDLSAPVYEFGSLKVAGQESRCSVRDLPGVREYVGCDLREGLGVDKILDLQHIDMPDKSVGTVIVLDVFEHVEFCRKSINEIHRILKPGGLLIITSVMYFPIHNHPADYWRFTPQGFRSLLAPFEISIIDTIGLKDFPCTIIGISFKAKHNEADYKTAKTAVNLWKKNFLNSWQEYVTIILPPFLFVWLYSFYRKIETAFKK